MFEIVEKASGGTSIKVIGVGGAGGNAVDHFHIGGLGGGQCCGKKGSEHQGFQVHF